MKKCDHCNTRDAEMHCFESFRGEQRSFELCEPCGQKFVSARIGPHAEDSRNQVVPSQAEICLDPDESLKAPLTLSEDFKP